MSDELVALIAKRFIQRRDVKAVQFSNGAYSPDKELKNLGSHAPLGFKVQHLRDHLAGTATYGHYLLDAESKARLFAFDIDLMKTGSFVKVPDWSQMPPELEGNIEAQNKWIDSQFIVTDGINPREIWLDRRALDARNWYKLQFGQLARTFTKVIREDLGLPCAAAYSGAKGIHVYGFTGEMPAMEVRAAANLVLEIMDCWEPLRGVHTFKHRVTDPSMGYPSMSVEVFPKQDNLDGKDLGNLMRLPLGRNQKSADPTFFLDLTSPAGQMIPHSDPVKLLETGDPYL